MGTRSFPHSFRSDRRQLMASALAVVAGLAIVDEVVLAADATPAASPQASPAASPVASPAGSPSAEPKAVFQASIQSFRFVPQEIAIPAGTTVVWTNKDVVQHTVTHKVRTSAQLFASPLISPGGSFSFTFDTPGTYAYFCVPHPFMTGTVVVS